MSTAIRAEGLSKSYVIHHQQRESYTNFRDVLAGGASALWRRVRHPLGGLNLADPAREEFWALRDVSFEIAQGERVGIIGRNGAGKSTLLKLLSRITEPTHGRLAMRGRVASLLEVGTGFHPELTGRENIFLNGAILGMSRAEIKRKFDEIVEFAEVERFLDTPVKRYSSGMYVRLAFAVAANLEPDILLVDEVLAVGDVDFQKKCLGKMDAVAHEGRTVLFVSHQLNAVQSLCSRCIWLAHGELVAQGDTRTIISEYTRAETSANEWNAREGNAVRSPYFAPSRLCIVDEGLVPVTGDIPADEAVGVLIEANVDQLHPALTVGFAVTSSSGELLFWAYHTDSEEQDWPPIEVGENRLVGWIPRHFLNEGEYRVELLASLHFQEWISQPGLNAPSVRFAVRGQLSRSPYWMMARPGLMAPHISFRTIKDDGELGPRGGSRDIPAAGSVGRAHAFPINR